MEFENYINQVVQRYMQLPEKEKEGIRRFKETKNGQLMSELLGPELRPLLDRLAAPKNKGLAARKK